ncbi:MAG: hypothetical protein NDI69_17765 [Bacteriovoracaceae bacterium]|nr:hypothetical protein [Bacteriovoracaceae bacterium]
MKFILPLSLLLFVSCSSVKTNEASAQLLSKNSILSRSIASNNGVVEGISQAFKGRMTQIRGCYQDEMRRSKKIDNALVRINFSVNNGQISNFKAKGL